MPPAKPSGVSTTAHTATRHCAAGSSDQFLGVLSPQKQTVGEQASKCLLGFRVRDKPGNPLPLPTSGSITQTGGRLSMVQQLRQPGGPGLSTGGDRLLCRGSRADHQVPGVVYGVELRQILE